MAWYLANKREMPWRGATDPYAVWVSEIMLQQTRVETVRGYYDRFMAAFPSVESLARAPLDRVLKRWEGLGYYSRARNLHRAAQEVVRAGGFPDTAAGFRALPGVGAYTAAAVASICFGEAEPVVDGNVARVVLRLCARVGDAKDPKLRPEFADWLRPRMREAGGAPGDFNQAIMELGETLCVPRGPRCVECPLRDACAAFASGRPEAFPAAPFKAALPIRTFFAFLAFDASGKKVLLRKRPAGGLLGGLWELPMAEVPATAKSPRQALGELRKIGLSATAVDEAGAMVHDFSHFRQILRVWRIRSTVETPPRGFRFAVPTRLALATASRKIIERLSN